MDAERTRAQVLELRSAGLGFAAIATNLHLESAEVARTLYLSALDDTDVRFDVALEVRRIDRLFSVAWAKAAKGDLAAMDRVLKFSERRERLVGWSRDLKHEMREAFDETVASLPGIDRARHASVIAAGRVIADRIDAAMCDDDRTELTKSLYLIPHLINVLRELGATPAQEAPFKAAAPQPTAGGVTTSGGTAGRRARAAQRRGAIEAVA